MKENLYVNFMQACKRAKEIYEMPEIPKEQLDKIFQHVSIADIHTTMHTIAHVHSMALKEQARLQGALCN